MTQPHPQGQRKELPGQEGQGSGPRMEENELYSSATTGEWLPALPGRGGRRCGPAGASSCLWLSQCGHPLIRLSASLPGLAQVEEPGCLDCQPFTRFTPSGPGPAGGRGRAEGFMGGAAALEPSVGRSWAASGE